MSKMISLYELQHQDEHNKEITIYELLGLIKEDKAPKKIKYRDKIFILDNGDYEYYDDGYALFENELYNVLTTSLDDTIEILDEENDEFEDIKEMETFSDVNFYNWFNLDESIRKTNQLIRNQKLLINKIGELNGRNMD